MPIQTACTHCEATYNLPDDKAGKTVRCKKCQKTFTVSGGKSGGSGRKGKDDDKIQAKAPQRKANARQDDDDDDDDDDKGKGKKKKTKDKAKKKSPMLLIAAGGGGALLLIIAAVAWMLMSGGDATTPADQSAKTKGKKDPQQVAQNKGGDIDKKGEGPDDKKGGMKGKGKGKGGKGKMDKGDMVGEKEKKIEKVEKKIEEVKEYPPLRPDDPIRIHYEKLLLDRQRNAADVKSAAEFFLRTDPHVERDVHGFLHGFKDHPWRGKVSKKLELLIDHEDFLKSKLYWDAYIAWVVPEDFGQLVLHLSRAGEHRPMLLERIAGFRTPEAAELIVDNLSSSHQELVIRLIQDLGGRLCLNLIFPYIWHPDYELSRIADDLVKGFDLDIDHKLYQGPISDIPRLPKPQEELTLDLAVQILSGSGGGGGGSTGGKSGGGKMGGKSSGGDYSGWNSEERFRRLMTLGWLQDQALSQPHWEKISQALDKMILLPDYPMRTNAFICMERWVSDGNMNTLLSSYKKESGATKTTCMNLMKRIPKAQKTILTLWPDMEGDLQASMVGWMFALTSEDAKASLIKYFNHNVPVIQATAREAAKRWNIDQEYLVDMAMQDTAKKETKVHALRWLKLQQPPLDAKKKTEYLKKLSAMAKPPANNDPKTPIDPEVLAAVAEAQAVLARWSSEPPEALIALLENPEFSGSGFQTVRIKAIQTLGIMKHAPAVPVIAMRYHEPFEKNQVVDTLKNMGSEICDPQLIGAFERSDKKKKIELLKVIELICASRSVYDTLEATLKQQPAIEQDLAFAIRAALKKMDSRLKGLK